MTTYDTPVFENSNVLVCHRVIDGTPVVNVFRAGTVDKLNAASHEILSVLISGGELTAPTPLDLTAEQVRVLDMSDDDRADLSDQECEFAQWVLAVYRTPFFQYNRAVENFRHAEAIIAGETPWRKLFGRTNGVSVDEWRARMQDHFRVENGTARFDDDALYEKVTPWGALVESPVFHKIVFIATNVDLLNTTNG